MLKKLLLILSVGAFSEVLADQAVQEIGAVKNELRPEQRNVIKLVSKLVKKETLTKQEEELLVDLRNYSVGTVTGLTLFYLTGGFSVLSAILLQSAFAVVGGVGVVECVKQLDWEYVKGLFKQIDEQKAEAETQINQ